MATKAPESWGELGQQFYMMIGYCIAEWASVDDELFQIFKECVGRYEQSVIIYYRTPGLNVRLGLTDELVRSVLPKPPKKDGGHDAPSVKAWKAAIDGFDDLLATRRRIAHHPVTAHAVPFFLGHSGLGQTQSWFEIYTNQHERQRSQKEKAALRVEDLQAHLKAVNELGWRLNRFYNGVLKKHAPK